MHCKGLCKGNKANEIFFPYTGTEVNIDTIPRYQRKNLLERYNEKLLIKTDLTLIENENELKRLKSY